MSKTIFNPLSGSYHIENHEHLGSYTDKKSAREAYKNMHEGLLRTLRAEGIKEHKHPHWGKGE